MIHIMFFKYYRPGFFNKKEKTFLTFWTRIFIFFFETQNFKMALKLVAFDLDHRFGTIGKVILYSLKKHWFMPL